MLLVHGDVDVDGEISYMSRQPWIRNVSVKDNILFESVYDVDRYANACSVRRSLRRISHRFRTETKPKSASTGLFETLVCSVLFWTHRNVRSDHAGSRPCDDRMLHSKPQNLHDELFRRVLRVTVNSFFDVTPIDRSSNRFSNDLDQMDSVLPQQYHSVFQNLMMSIGALSVCFKRTSREVKRLEGISRTLMFILIGETLNGLSTIRAFKMQGHFGKMCNDAVDDHASVLFIHNTAALWLALRMDFVSIAISGVVSLYRVLTKGQLSAILAGMALTHSLKVTSTTQSTVRAFDAADNAMTSVKRLLHFRTIPVEDDGANCASVNRDLWPSQGSIEFENLRLKYRPELPLVLRGVGIEVHGGEKLGI
ncbi:Atp-binding protein, partial [Globisporangium splendens]